MTLMEQTKALRKQLQQWASDPEWELLVRYELLPQKPLPTWHQRLAHRVGRLLRVLGLSREKYRKQKWHPGLKHANPRADGKTLLLWCDVKDCEESREACASLKNLLSAYPDFIPVLVTPLADFAFYSRLGWLVEYLPDLPGEGPSYLERKKRYLAWRYRDALALPLSAGLARQEEFEELMHGREGRVALDSRQRGNGGGKEGTTS